MQCASRGAGEGVEGARSVRILIVITGLEVGGAELFLQRLVTEFSPALTPLVVSLRGLGPVGASLRTAGIRVEALGEGGHSLPEGVIQLFRLIREYRPDIVFTWLYHACLIGSLVAYLAGVRRIVWNVRNDAMPSGSGSWHTMLAARLCNVLSRLLPKRILCCSERAAAAHQAKGYPADRFLVVPNGFDTQLFSPDPEAHQAIIHELGLHEESILVGRIARDDPQKDLASYFRCCAILAPRYPAATFLMVGPGVDAHNERLVSLLYENGLEGRMLFLGERNDMPRLMSALDVLVSSSIAEGFPNVIGEAMSCATACVVTDVGESAAMLASCGQVVPPGDPQALAAGVAAVLDMNPSARTELGGKGRQRIVNEYGISAVAARYERILLDSLTL